MSSQAAASLTYAATSLPIHPSLRDHEREMIVNGVCFHAVGALSKADLRFDWPALAADLAAGARAAA